MGAHEDERKNERATLNKRWGEGERGAGSTDRGDESERNFTSLCPAVCVFRISTLTGGRGAQMIARGMRTYCAG